MEIIVEYWNFYNVSITTGWYICQPNQLYMLMHALVVHCKQASLRDEWDLPLKVAKGCLEVTPYEAHIPSTTDDDIDAITMAYMLL